MLIFKEGLPIATADIREVLLPYQTIEEAKEHILKVDLQYDIPCVWYQADGSKQEPKKFAFIAIGTGHHIKSDKLTADNYIGTLLLCGGELVLHYFIVECI